MKAFLTIQKKTALAILGAITAVLLALSCLLMGNTTVASAEETVTFSMVNAASVYLEGENTSGIRFAARVPEEDKDQMVSFLVIHKEMLTANDKMSVSTNINEKGDVVAQLCAAYGIEEAKFEDYFTVTEAKKSAYYTEEEFPVAGYYACGAIVDLPSTTYANEFFAVAYYTNAENTRVYASFDESVTRSIAEVANGALAKNYEKYLGLGKVNTLLSFMESYGADRFAYVTADRQTLTYNQYYTTMTTPEVVEYSNGSYVGVNNATNVNTQADNGTTYRVLTPTTGEIVAPVTEDNKSLVKYTIDAVTNEHNIASVPMWYSSSQDRTLSAEAKAVVEEAVANNKRVHMSFYIYNATGSNEYVLLIDQKKNYNWETALQYVYAPNGQWTYVDFALPASAMKGVEDYQFGVLINAYVEGSVYKDVAFEGVAKSSQHVYYIDGVSFSAKDAIDSVQYTPNYTRTLNTEAANDYDNDGISYKYSFTHGFAVNESIGINTASRGQFFHYKTAVGDDMLFNIDSQTDWANLYCGFYFKQESAFTGGQHWNFLLRFRNSQDGGKTWKGHTNMTFSAYDKNIDVWSNDTNWHYVEFKLSDVISLYTENVNCYEMTLNTECGTSAAFYCDGLKLFVKDPMDLATHSASYQMEKSTAQDQDGDGVSYKYTYTRPTYTDSTDGIQTENRSRFFYYKATVGEDTLFGLDANTDWNNLYIGFYLIQEEKLASGDVNILMCFRNTTDGSNVAGSGTMVFGGYGTNQNTGNPLAWKYVEFNISSIASAMHKENVKTYEVALNTEITVESAVFYIDGLSIYEGSKLA